MVIDELDLYMTDDNKISAVSNYYKQWIDENDADSPMKYSANTLVTIDFEPVSSLEIKRQQYYSSVKDLSELFGRYNIHYCEHRFA